MQQKKPLFLQNLFTFCLFCSVIFSLSNSSSFSCCCCPKKKNVVPINQMNDTLLFPIFREPSITKYFQIDPEITVKHQQFMILGASYTILKQLHFVGLYLPLKSQSQRYELQRIYLYFGAFKQGVDRVNVERTIQDFYVIRDKTLNLWNINAATPTSPRFQVDNLRKASMMDKLKMKVLTLNQNETEHIWDKTGFCIEKSRWNLSDSKQTPKSI